MVSAIRASVLGALLAIVVVACGGSPAPSKPANFRMYDHEYTLVRLSWDAPTGAAVAAYELKRDSVLITPPAANETTTTNVGLTENSSYTYGLRACDARALCSDWATTTANTADDPSNNGGDTQAPSVPGGLAKTGATASTIALSWSASTDNVGVTSYEIWRDGALAGTTDGATRTFTDTGLSANTTYSYKVRARDAAGNWSNQSSALSTATSASVDNSAPTIPGGLTKAGSTSNSISLSWAASTDNVGVTGYEVFRGTTSVGTTNASTLSFNDTGLAASTSYSYYVRARDAAGNWSAKSSALNVSTDAASGLYPPDSANVPAGYSLVWNDEFDANGLPNSGKWGYDTWGNTDGWANGELQYYAPANTNNANVSGGKLSITARLETVTSNTNHVFKYTSARMVTSDKASWTYGYFEVRAKMPCGAGTWPAIWMLGTSGSWPDGGEIDILEHFYNAWPTLATANVHYGPLAKHVGNGGNTGLRFSDVPDICTAFHNYWLLWTADKLEIGIDSNAPHQSYAKVANATYEQWPFSLPQYLLLNLAIDKGPVNDNIFPRIMEVEYVRVYQKP